MCVDMELLVPDYVAGFRLWRVYLPEAPCHRRSPRPSLFVRGILQLLCQLETVVFHFINRRSKHGV